MNLYARLEKRFSKYAISGLTRYIIACYLVGYIMTFINRDMMYLLTLEPAYIIQGQIWRIFTWILIPPSSFSIFTIIMLFFYYTIGTNLEVTWGKFRYNLFIFSGIFFTILGAFILLLIGYFYSGAFGTMGNAFSTYYISMSIFLAYALTYPDMEVLFYFIIPIKMKWLGILDVVFLLYSFVMGTWSHRVAIFACLLNVIILFLQSKSIKKSRSQRIMKLVKVEREVSGKKNSTASPTYHHKCAVCGRTELDNPNLEFRYCSKCSGNYEYCQDHLFTHEHKS
ncbi:MAG TPA: hypothetical protein VIR32_06130 [Lachnospiraceae bacterium]